MSQNGHAASLLIIHINSLTLHRVFATFQYRKINRYNTASVPVIFPQKVSYLIRLKFAVVS